MCEVASSPDSGGVRPDRQAAIAVADELVGLTGALSDLAYDLGTDPETLRKHMGSLQAIDLITQIHLALADILRSTAPLDDRINGVNVEALATRLRAKLEKAGSG